MNENQGIPINLQDLYMLIGEREVIRYLQQKEVEKLNQQITEMSAEITRLRDSNGELGQPENNDPIRRVPSGVQGARSGFVPNVSGQPNESSSGNHPSSPFPIEAPRVGRVGVAGSTTGD